MIKDLRGTLKYFNTSKYDAAVKQESVLENGLIERERERERERDRQREPEKTLVTTRRFISEEEVTGARATKKPPEETCSERFYSQSSTCRMNGAAWPIQSR